VLLASKSPFVRFRHYLILPRLEQWPTDQKVDREQKAVSFRAGRFTRMEETLWFISNTATLGFRFTFNEEEYATR
jgi:hypothetical protein